MTGDASPGDVYLLPDGGRVAILRKARDWRTWAPSWIVRDQGGDEYAARPDASWVLDTLASWAFRAGFKWADAEPEAS